MKYVILLIVIIVVAFIVVNMDKPEISTENKTVSEKVYPGPMEYQKTVQNNISKAEKKFNQGNVDGGLSDFLMIVEDAHNYRVVDGSLISNLIAISAESKVHTSLRSIILQRKLSKNKLKQIIDKLTKIDKSEKNVGELLFLKESQQDLTKYTLNDLPQLREKNWTEENFQQNIQILQNEKTKVWNEVIRLCNVPADEYLKTGKTQIEKQIKISAGNGDLIKEMIPDYTLAFIRYQVMKSQRRIICVMAALEILKLDNGSIPSTDGNTKNINTLQISLDQTICVDPFKSDSTLSYMCVSNRYKVWSVGPDLKNNNAKIEYSKDNGLFSNGDIVF